LENIHTYICSEGDVLMDLYLFPRSDQIYIHTYIVEEILF